MSTCTPRSKSIIPNYASAIVTTNEIVGAIASPLEWKPLGPDRPNLALTKAPPFCW